MRSETPVIHKRRSLLVFCWALLAAAACSPRRDLGQTGDADAREMEGGECEAPRRGEPLDTPKAQLASDFAGAWIGAAEDALAGVPLDVALPLYAFPSGSTRILLEITQTAPLLAQLTFGERPLRAGSESAGPAPSEGVEYAAEPAGNGDDGTLVLAFSPTPASVSELYVRRAGDGLVGVFDGLDLEGPQGSLTRPGSVRFRPASGADDRR